MSGSSPTPARKPWRWLLVIVATALLAGILPGLMLAQWGPYLLGRVLSAYLQTSVSVQGVTGGWWNGLTVHRLTVFEDLMPQAPTLVHVEQLSVNLPLVSLLLSSRPLALSLDAVYIDLRRRRDGRWNLTPFLEAFGAHASARPPTDVITPRLNRQVAVTVTSGKLRLGQGIEFADLAAELHWAEGGVSITRAGATLAGGVIALQGDLPLGEHAPREALQWRLAGIHLDQLLGHAFQPATIAEATGSVTLRGDGLALEASIQIPTLALVPGPLGQRQPYLTDATLTCTLRLPPSFARLTTDACRLRAAEAHVSLHDSAVELGPEPRLALRVEGSLGGSLVGAMVPEVPGEFPDPVHVDGQITIPFSSMVWHEIGWRLAVTTSRFVFDDTLTEVQATVVKSTDRIEVVDLHARRGAGRIHGAGAWQLAHPEDGSLRIHLEHLPFRQSFAHGATGGPYALAGVITGTVTWQTGYDRDHCTVDGHVNALHLSHGAAMLVQVPEGSVRGALGRERDGIWRGDQLVFRSDGLAVELTNVVVGRTLTQYDLAGTLHLQAAPEVMTGIAGGLLPGRLKVSGPIELAGKAAGHIPVGGGVSPGDLTYSGDLRVAGIEWDGTLWEEVTARLVAARGRLTIDDARARILGGWMRLRPETFVDLQGPRRDFQLHLAAEQLDLRLETGKRVPLLALLIPLFLLEPDRSEPIRMSGMFDAEIRASGSYDGLPGWSQSVNGAGSFRIAQGAVVGSTVISGFVTKALTLPANLVDQSLKALLEREGQPLQVLEGLLRRTYNFGTLHSPIALRAGEIHLADHLTISAPEFSLVINGSSSLDGTVDYDVHSDLVHRLLFGEVINLAEKIPMLGTVLRHINPFQLIHRHLELSATVQGNLFERTTAGQPAVHVNVYFVQ